MDLIRIRLKNESMPECPICGTVCIDCVGPTAKTDADMEEQLAAEETARLKGEDRG
jgi:hypothetical protein